MDKMNATTIVKLQISLNDGGGRVLVYDRDLTVFAQHEATPYVRKILDGRVKAFFEAVVIPELDKVTILGPAPDQDW
jgi:hypothetical protein